MTFRDRAALLRKVAQVLNDHLPELYDIAYTYGATKKDAWIDIEGGIAAVAVYSSLGRRHLPAARFLVDGEVAGLSKEGSFVGRHIQVPLEGVAVQINAFNFPSWGFLEKLAPSLLAGMPALVKPATPTAWLTHRMVELIVESGVLPEGALQLICGSAGDLLDHLTCQDVLSFTGSAGTGRKLRGHSNVIAQAVRINVEADSLNAAVLGPDVATGSPLFDLFIKEVASEMTIKAGQKCTAIRRILVPAASEVAVIEALSARLSGTTVGDPANADAKVRMGPLVDHAAVTTAREGIAKLQEDAEIVHGDPNRQEFLAEDGGKSGAFLEPILLRAKDPASATRVHQVEVFGPVATVLAYGDLSEAVALTRKGDGSLVASAFSEDDAFVTELALGIAPYHGRLLLMSEAAAAESTGHGIVMPQLVHGGPGRAGGGEELGGLRGVGHYLQRVALQGAPERLEKLCAPALGES
jgi:oxepin-CoA hydrolase/3-oxo-5,6-dehydrosuberyl-CoA semialdehyde dehydrogenase